MENTFFPRNKWGKIIKQTNEDNANSMEFNSSDEYINECVWS